MGQGDQVESRENREVRGIKMRGIVKKKDDRAEAIKRILIGTRWAGLER